jgi:hypothetical protein
MTTFRIAAVCLLSAWVSDAFAAENCESNFVVQGIMSTGYQYLSYVFVPPSDAGSTLMQIKEAAGPSGYRVADERQVDDQMQMLLTAVAKGNPIIVTVNTKNGHVGVGMQASAGTPMISESVKATLCGLLNQGTANSVTSSAPPDSTSERTAPPAARQRTSPPDTPLRVVQPHASFDLASAKAALEEGAATIRGTACIRRAGNLVLARNQHVYLYPATPYLREAIDLMAKTKPDKERLEISPQAIATRMDAMTNSQGQFQFSRMKLGSYYLLTTLSVAIGGVKDVDRGSAQTGANEITFYHELVPYTNHFDDVLDKYVDVKHEGETIDIVLTTHIKWSTIFIEQSQSHAGIFGCARGF